MNMIVGVTHDCSGRTVQRLSVSTKIAIGLPPNGERNYPTKLDHFVFLTKKRTAKGFDWALDSELTEHYGKECRAVRIVLLDDDIENVFPTSYAWWTAVERRCWGNGAQATRRTAARPNGQPWKPCGIGCPELSSGMCKPSGDLRFVLADFPRLGSVCRIHTSSYRSIRQIHSALQEIQSFTGGRLAGLTAKLVVRPEEMAYFDPKDRRKKSTTIWALSLEVDGEDMRKLFANLTENARVFAETRKLLGNGRGPDVVEAENEQASELMGEFYSVPEPSAPAGDRVAGREDQYGSPPALNERAAAEAAVLRRKPASVPAQSNVVDEAPRQAPPWEEEANSGPTGDLEARAAETGNKAPRPATAAAGEPRDKTTANGSPTETIALRGVVGPLEPDANGNTLRRSKRGVEYVTFKLSQNGTGTTVYCNRPELVPEIARHQGREGAAQVSVAGDNGRRYFVLETFIQT